MSSSDKLSLAADHHLRRNRHPQPLRPRPRRQGLQADGAGDQAARRGQRGRAPGAARAAQFVGGVFLVEAGVLSTRADRRVREVLELRRCMATMRYAFNATKVAEFPLVESRPLDLATRLDAQARESPAICPPPCSPGPTPLCRRAPTSTPRSAASSACAAGMIATQEELDWRCYRLYGLLPPDAEPSAFEHPDAARGGARASAPSRSCSPAAWPPAPRRRPGSSATARRPSPTFPPTGPRTTGRSCSAASTCIEPRPQHRPDRAARVQAPLERAVVAVAGTGRAARLAARPAGVARLLAAAGRSRRRRAADHVRRPPRRRRRARRRLHAGRRALRRPCRLRPAPARRRPGRRRVGALPARAALHRHRPAQARPVGSHLGPAAARGRDRRRGRGRRSPRLARGTAPRRRASASACPPPPP